MGEVKRTFCKAVHPDNVEKQIKHLTLGHKMEGVVALDNLRCRRQIV